MKFYELVKILDPLQDEITILFPDDVKLTYIHIFDIPINYADYRVSEVYGYDGGGYDGIMISIVEE